METTGRQQESDAAGKPAIDTNDMDLLENDTTAASKHLRMLPALDEQVPSRYISRKEDSTKNMPIDVIVGDIFAQTNTASEKANTAGPGKNKDGKMEPNDGPVNSCFEQNWPKPEDFKIDEQTRRQVIEKLVQELKDRYVLPGQTEEAAKLLASKEKGEYAEIDSAEKFAQALEKDLYSVFKDKHLMVFFDNQKLADDLSTPSKEDSERQLKQQICEKHGIESVQTLEGNIGYLKLNGFFPGNPMADQRGVEMLKEAIGSSMAKLADKDALIIDLRDNSGGDPHAGLKFLNHLLEPGVNVNNIHWREGRNTRVEPLITSDPGGPKFGSQKPIYVLTGKDTFSAGEEFAYNLQALGRARVIGETTGGGANPTYAFRLSDHFGVAIPIAQSINPITNKNWEGAGVQPDIKVPADKALEKAKDLLLLELGRKK